jgi:aryl-alcohol dehydrogenase-like predicted oxidoreductase
VKKSAKCTLIVLTVVSLSFLGPPLVGGLLTGKNRATTRAQTDAFGDRIYTKDRENNKIIIDRVLKVAEKTGHSAAQVTIRL